MIRNLHGSDTRRKNGLKKKGINHINVNSKKKYYTVSSLVAKKKSIYENKILTISK